LVLSAQEFKDFIVENQDATKVSFNIPPDLPLDTPVELPRRANTADPSIFGWTHKAQSAIADLAIDLHGADVISVGPKGDIALHPQGFQPELSLVSPYRSSEQPTGQLSLF
jgi:hypothetical protein